MQNLLVVQTCLSILSPYLRFHKTEKAAEPPQVYMHNLPEIQWKNKNKIKALAYNLLKETTDIDATNKQSHNQIIFFQNPTI